MWDNILHNDKKNYKYSRTSSKKYTTKDSRRTGECERGLNDSVNYFIRNKETNNGKPPILYERDIFALYSSDGARYGRAHSVAGSGRIFDRCYTVRFVRYLSVESWSRKIQFKQSAGVYLIQELIE